MELITRPTFTLTDRLRIQRERITDRKYRSIGFLMTILLERQMSTQGMSQGNAFERCANPSSVKTLASRGMIDEHMLPLAPWQAQAWTLLTLDWLHWRKAPLLAISYDRHDLLLPCGLTPLPDIPEPGYVSTDPLAPAPRIPQRLEDRACGRIKERNGTWWLIFQPLTELCVAIGGAKGGFGRIVCQTDPADGTKAALLVDPEPDAIGNYRAHFASGSFRAGW